MLEFDGGVADTHVSRAGADAPLWNQLDYVYRVPPASRVGARIPQGPAARAYDIGYFPRDTVSTPLAGDTTADAALAPAAAAALARPGLIAEPKSGSPGAVNPAVQRYDPSGLRSAMTATHAAVARSVALAREKHTGRATWEINGSGPIPGAIGRPAVKRLNAWGYTQTNDW